MNRDPLTIGILYGEVMDVNVGCLAPEDCADGWVACLADPQEGLCGLGNLDRPTDGDAGVASLNVRGLLVVLTEEHGADDDDLSRVDDSGILEGEGAG